MKSGKALLPAMLALLTFALMAMSQAGPSAKTTGSTVADPGVAYSRLDPDQFQNASITQE